MTECFEVPAAIAGTAWQQAYPEPTAVHGDDLRRAFRRHAGAVAVITTRGHAGPIGFTATSLASVSTDPPLLSFNIALTSSSWPAVSLARHLAVHVLSAHQEDLAQRFATSGADRFGAPTRWQPGPHGVPLLDAVAARLLVRTTQQVAVGDHAIVVAEVVDVEVTDGATPLIHHDGGFHALRRNGSGRWRRRG